MTIYRQLFPQIGLFLDFQLSWTKKLVIFRTLHCKVIEFNGSEKSETSVDLVWPEEDRSGQIKPENKSLLAALTCNLSLKKPFCQENGDILRSPKKESTFKAYSFIHFIFQLVEDM